MSMIHRGFITTEGTSRGSINTDPLIESHSSGNEFSQYIPELLQTQSLCPQKCGCKSSTHVLSFLQDKLLLPGNSGKCHLEDRSLGKKIKAEVLIGATFFKQEELGREMAVKN